MKPIILLAVIAIAVTGLGVGSLGNVITLDVQTLGIGDATLESQIDDATVKFTIEKVPGDFGFKNVISECIIQSGQDIVPESKIFCKLTDENGNVAAEGSRVLSATLFAHATTVIEIDDPQAFDSQVQNIHDIILVVQGPSTGSSP